MSSGQRAYKVLAIDTATDSVVTGVVEVVGESFGDTAVLAERVISDHRRHAELEPTPGSGGGQPDRGRQDDVHRALLLRHASAERIRYE